MGLRSNRHFISCEITSIMLMSPLMADCASELSVFLSCVLDYTCNLTVWFYAYTMPSFCVSCLQHGREAPSPDVELCASKDSLCQFWSYEKTWRKWITALHRCTFTDAFRDLTWLCEGALPWALPGYDWEDAQIFCQRLTLCDVVDKVTCRVDLVLSRSVCICSSFDWLIAAFTVCVFISSLCWCSQTPRLLMNAHLWHPHDFAW